MASSRRCPECGKPRTLKTFGKRAQRCKYCARQRASDQRHASHAKATYALEPGEYEALLEAQGGTCAVCPRKPVRRRHAVDHDHKLEAELGIRASLRGLLCKQHNNVLRDCRDDAALLRRLADYLDDPPARRVLEP